MRTTLNLDNNALADAMKFSKGLNKTQVINLALREYARRMHLKQLLRLKGKHPWEGDLDQLRKRS